MIEAGRGEGEGRKPQKDRTKTSLLPDVLSLKWTGKRVCLCSFTALHNIYKTCSTCLSCAYLLWHRNSVKLLCCSIQFCAKIKLYGTLTIFSNVNFLSKKTCITQCIFTKDRCEVLSQLINSYRFYTNSRNTENFLPHHTYLIQF